MAITLYKNKTGSLWNPSSAKHCIRRQTSAEILFSGLYTIWKHGTTVVSSMRAQIGDTVKYINSTTVGCYDSNSNERWRVVVSKATNTVLYEYTGTPAITNFTYAITSTESKSVVASGVDRRKMKYAVNVTAGSGWTGVYTSTSSTATSGNASGHKYETGARVYYFAKTTDATLENYYAPFTLGTPVYNSNGTKYYCIGSVVVLTSDKTVTVPALEGKPLTIYFAGTGTQWVSNGASVPYMTAYYGDYLSVSGTTITCKYPSKATRWTVTASIMTDTVEWDFGGNVVLPTINDEQITSVKTIKNEAGTAVKKKYAVTINGLSTTGSPTGYLSTSLTATSGSSSGSTFDYGSNVFAFAKIPHNTLSLYTTPDSWEYNKHDASNIYYMIGSLGQVIEDTSKNLIYVSGLSAKQSVKISLTGTGITWKNGNTIVSSMTAYVGDLITNISSTAVACYYKGIDGTSYLRWSVTATRSANTTQYIYSGTPTIVDFEWNLNSTTSKSISAGGIGTTLQSYTISITKPSMATEAYVSSTSNATSGSTSASFTYGTTVYGFAKTSGSPSEYDLKSAGWIQIHSTGQYNWYRIGQLTVSGAASISYTTPSLKKSKVSITKGTDWYGAYVSTSSSATSGSSSLTVDYGTTVYGFAKVLNSTLACYNIPDSWVHVKYESEYNYYRVNSVAAGLSDINMPYTNWTRKPIKVKVSAPAYVKGTYVSAYGGTTSGLASGTTFAPGTTVYGYVKLDASYFDPNPSWTSVGKDSNGYICYRVGSVTVPTSLTIADQTISSGNAIGKAATVYLATIYVDWKINGTAGTYCTAYNGDQLVASGATISCSDQTGNVRWTATATRKANTAQYTYTGTPTAVLPYSTVMGTGTASIKGVTRTINKYTVKWMTYDGGTTLETDTNVEYGTKATFNGTNPIRDSSAQYNYSFAGWSTSKNAESGSSSGNMVGITGDTTYYAAYSKTTREYTVKWYNGSTLLEIDSVAYNTKPDYNGSTPTKASTAQYTYTWSNQWSASSSATSGVTEANLPVVTSNVSYYAVGWTPTTRKYKVIWKNADGTILETDNNVAYGTTPTYNGSTPTKAADDQYTYSFLGWNTASTATNVLATLPNVTGTVTYYAIYKATTRPYTITFKNSNVANWTSFSETAYSGDTITKQTGRNSGHVICAYLDSNSNLAQRWKVRLMKKSDTAQYTYKMTSWDFVLPSTSVSRDMTINAPSGSVTTRTYAVSFNAPTVDGVTLFTSTNNLSLSGNGSGYKYSYGSTVYLMASVSVYFPSSHTMPSNWKQMNCNGSIYTYQIGSPITVNSAYSFGTATMPTVPRLTAPTLISEESTAVADTSGAYDTCCSVTFKNPNNIAVTIYYNIYYNKGSLGSGYTAGSLAAGASFTKDFYVTSGTKWYIWFKADGYLDSDYISGTASSGSGSGGGGGGDTTA